MEQGKWNRDGLLLGCLMGGKEAPILREALYPGAEGAGGILCFWSLQNSISLGNLHIPAPKAPGTFLRFWSLQKAISLRNPYVPAPKAPGKCAILAPSKGQSHSRGLDFPITELVSAALTVPLSASRFELVVTVS